VRYYIIEETKKQCPRHRPRVRMPVITMSDTT
jgi:hypothetical protein